jgi:hypothetical protein
MLSLRRGSKAIAIENDLRGTLRNFGLKVGMIGKARFEARIQELFENFRDHADDHRRCRHQHGAYSVTACV